MSFNNKDKENLTLSQLERGEWRLWFLVLLITFIYALCIIIVASPDIWGEAVHNVAPFTFLALLTGLFILSVLLCIYLIYRVKEIKRLRMELIADERLKLLGNIAARVAHEINNDLLVAQGYCELLLTSEPPPEIKEDLVKIYDKQKEIGYFTHDLLIFGRKKKVTQYELVDLKEIIENALESLQVEFTKNLISIKKELPETAMPVQGERHELTEVLVNICKNAIESMEKSPTKELTVKGTLVKNTRLTGRQIGQEWLIHISDTGTGFTAEEQKNLFTPFFTTKPVGKGTGLGLGISYTFVKMHGGNIIAQNNQSGGATFIIELPAYLPLNK
ncbi:MAG: ATP-binding protein [Planctomycetota bacterium]